MEEPVTQRVIFSTCLSRAAMVDFQSHRDSLCVRPSNRMIYRHLFNGTLNALQIQYCPNHILVSFCHLSYTWTLCVPPRQAVIVWLLGNCQLGFHISPRKTSLGRVSLWPNPLLNGLQSQTENNWRYLS